MLAYVHFFAKKSLQLKKTKRKKTRFGVVPDFLRVLELIFDTRGCNISVKSVAGVPTVRLLLLARN